MVYSGNADSSVVVVFIAVTVATNEAEIYHEATQ